MKKFCIIKTLAKNTANVGDEFIIEEGHCRVVKITKDYVYFSNKKKYPRILFNKIMRITAHTERKHKDADKTLKYLLEKKREIRILKKEAKAIYDENRQPGINRLEGFITLPSYIMLTSGGKTIKTYLSPNIHATPEELELSYQSLHGVSYKAFAHGHYIRQENKILLIGKNSFAGRNISDARINFGVSCLKKENYDVMFLTNLDEIFRYYYLLSSESSCKNSDTEEQIP